MLLATLGYPSKNVPAFSVSHFPPLQSGLAFSRIPVSHFDAAFSGLASSSLAFLPKWT